MRNWKMLAIAVGVSTSIALLASCGGGGGDDKPSPGATKSVRSAAPLADMALSAASFGAGAQGGSLGSPQARMVAAARTTRGSSEQSLNTAVARFQRSSARTRTVGTQAIAPSECASGGSVVVNGDTLVYTNCEDIYGDTKFFQNGTLTYTSDDLATSGTFAYKAGAGTTPYVYRISIINGATTQPEFEMSMLADVSGASTVNMCETTTEIGYANSTMSMTGEFRFKTYANGTLIADDTLKATGLTQVITVAAYDPDCITPTDLTLTENGEIQFTDHLDATNNTSMKVSGLVLHSIISTNTANQKILTTSMSGSMTVTSPCFTGSITFATVENIVEVLDPLTEEADGCPIAGKLVISGSVVGTVTYTSTGGVQIDNGSDGTVDQAFESCDDADVCG